MNRGHNYLLDEAYRQLARTALHIDLLVTAVCFVVIAIIWRFA